jgi:hypothetical protein
MPKTTAPHVQHVPTIDLPQQADSHSEDREPLPALDYSENAMSYDLVDAINLRYTPSDAAIVSRHVFGSDADGGQD